MAEVAREVKCIIETKDGPIRGYIDKTEDGNIYKFKRIPYAKPPLGALRFLPPTPMEAWSSLKDCTEDATPPFSFRQSTGEIFGSEDCLYIEISTPCLHPDRPLPVMFWIGCYMFTFSIDSILDPTLLNAQDVIFVRCGFRLGPFGFLSVTDFTAPGNCGLKDIVLALKWVQNNIRCFGGDPSNVTLFGASSGGAIVHLMMLSPMAQGLFHKAIIQSACALNNWAISNNPMQRALGLAAVLQIQKTYTAEVVEQLKTVPAEEIMQAFMKLVKQSASEDRNNVVDAVFKPCIEVDFEGQPAFLTRNPITIIKSGTFNKVPLIIGSNNLEANILQYSCDFYKEYEKINKNVELLVPKKLCGETKVSKDIGRQLLTFYFGEEGQVREDTKVQYMQLIGDYHFLYYVNKTLRLHCQYAPECPIYYYIFNFKGQWDLPDKYNFFNCGGHSTEVSFIFRIKIPDAGICKGSRDSETTRSRVIAMWTNFSKYGNPTPSENDQLLKIKWNPVEDENNLNYLSIGSELTKGINPFQERMEFWDDLHKEHLFLRALMYFNDLGVTW